MSGVRMLYILKDRWKFIHIHQHYSLYYMALIPCKWQYTFSPNGMKGLIQVLWDVLQRYSCHHWNVCLTMRLESASSRYSNNAHVKQSLRKVATYEPRILNTNYGNQNELRDINEDVHFNAP